MVVVKDWMERCGMIRGSIDLTLASKFDLGFFDYLRYTFSFGWISLNCSDCVYVEIIFLIFTMCFFHCLEFYSDIINFLQ